MDAVTLALSKKYTKDTAAGMGAVKGAACQVQSIAQAEGGKNVTFLWEDNAGTQHTGTMFVPDGADATVNGVNTLTVVAGENITITQEGSTMTISAGGAGPEPEPESTGIYGVTWDGSSSTYWTRTDDAALFSDPVPYMAGMTAEECSSPFDTIQPWAGMVRVTDDTCGELVAIPKFYYSLEQEGAGLSIKISPSQQEGFSCSPAHMDRGDGKGERDVVYVGRYHCGGDYKSTTGVYSKRNMTRSTARSSIHELGNTIWQFDFATRFTIWLLYLVEFANWNSQSAIGYGCGSGGKTEILGTSDSMPYHTGTMQSARKTYGVGVQYRNIEGLWDNEFDWCDGIYYDSNGINLILNPSHFSDSANGTAVGVPLDGYPTAFSISGAGGYQMFYPTAASGSETTYSCDRWGFSASNPCLYFGASTTQYTSYGLFFIGASSSSSDKIGTRLMVLPNPT